MNKPLECQSRHEGDLLEPCPRYIRKRRYILPWRMINSALNTALHLKDALYVCEANGMQEVDDKH